jgi:hypothetical protein
MHRPVEFWLKSRSGIYRFEDLGIDGHKTMDFRGIGDKVVG